MDLASKMVWEIRNGYGLKSERVLSAMKFVPRHKFVSRVQEITSYSDNPISIGYGQTMSQPYTVAYMTYLLTRGVGTSRLRRWKVLEIGTGSGYQAAVLSELVGKVYTIEIISELARSAEKKLRELGYKNVYVKKGSGEFGWKEHALYDGILITAALDKAVPDELIRQTKVGGVIVAPIGPSNLQTMMRFVKQSDGKLKKQKLEKFVFVPFIFDKS